MIGLVLVVLCGLVVVGLVLAARMLDETAWHKEMVVFRLRFPRGLSAEQVMAFLSTLPPAGRGLFGPPPFVLDVIARDIGVEHRLSVPRSTGDAIRVQFQTALPGVRLEEITDEELPSTSRGIELRMTSRVHPLAGDRAESAATALLASLAPLEPGEVVHLQWLIRGAAVPAVAKRQEPVGGLQAGPRVRDGEDLRGLRNKHAEPLL